MEAKQIKKTMRKYGRAWEKKNIELLLSCFTYEGIYQESPLTNPYKGNKEIKKFWNNVVIKNSDEIKFKLGKCYVSNDKKRGFAEWECKNKFRGKKVHMVGIMILRMKGDKITYLNEYWNTKIIK